MEEKIQSQIKLNKYIFSLPKIDIHAHLNGSIRLKTLFELSSEEDQNRLSKLYSKQISLNSAFEVFKISSKILTNLQIVSRITKEMLEDWNKQNCIYLEIRTTLKTIGDSPKSDYLRTVLQEIQKGNKIHTLQTRLIISLNREYSQEDYLDTFEVYKNFEDSELKKLIVGIDYCGNEQMEKHKLFDIYPIFKKFRDEGLKITVHSGESPNYQKFDFEAFRPDRISHTYYYKDSEYEEVMKRKIPIEICPTSSYCVKELNEFKEITFSKYYKKIVEINENENKTKYEYDLYCINTDDTMLFNSDLMQEYYEVAVNFEMKEKEVKEMILRTIGFIFEENEEFREKLRMKLKNF